MIILGVFPSFEATGWTTVQMAVGGREVEWRAAPDRLRYRHQVWVNTTPDVDPPTWEMRCGIQHMAQVLQTRLDDFGPAWDAVVSVLLSLAAAERVARREREAAYQQGRIDGMRACAESLNQRERRARKRPAYLYLMRSDELLKIGFSHRPEARRRDLQQAGREIVLLAKRRHGNEEQARAAEREAHALFAHLRVRGEWFSDSEEIRAFFGLDE